MRNICYKLLDFIIFCSLGTSFSSPNVHLYNTVVEVVRRPYGMHILRHLGICNITALGLGSRNIWIIFFKHKYYLNFCSLYIFFTSNMAKSENRNFISTFQRLISNKWIFDYYYQYSETTDSRKTCILSYMILRFMNSKGRNALKSRRYVRLDVS